MTLHPPIIQIPVSSAALPAFDRRFGHHPARRSGKSLHKASEAILVIAKHGPPFAHRRCLAAATSPSRMPTKQTRPRGYSPASGRIFSRLPQQIGSNMPTAITPIMKATQNRCLHALRSRPTAATGLQPVQTTAPRQKTASRTVARIMIKGRQISSSRVFQQGHPENRAKRCQ